jgi:hypothetical protein
MAITLASDITGPADNPVFLSEDPGSDVFLIDAEQMRVITHASSVTRNPRYPEGAGQGSIGPAQVIVKRGFGGTQAGPHTAGAVVAPLFPVYTTLAGYVIVPDPPDAPYGQVFAVGPGHTSNLAGRQFGV